MYNYSTSARILPPPPLRSGKQQDSDPPPLQFRGHDLPSHQFYSTSSLYSYTPTTSSEECPEHGSRSHRRTTIVLAFCIVLATVGVLSIGGLAAYLGVLSRNGAAFNSSSSLSSRVEESYLFSADESNLVSNEELTTQQQQSTVEVVTASTAPTSHKKHGSSGRRTGHPLESDESLQNEGSEEFRRYYEQQIVHNSIAEEPPSTATWSTSTSTRRPAPPPTATTRQSTMKSTTPSPPSTTTSSSHNYGAVASGEKSHQPPAMQQYPITHINYVQRPAPPFTRPSSDLDLSRLNSRPLLQGGYPLTSGQQHGQLGQPLRATVVPTTTSAPPQLPAGSFFHRQGQPATAGVPIDREFSHMLPPSPILAGGGFRPSSPSAPVPATASTPAHKPAPSPASNSDKFIPSKLMRPSMQFDGGEDEEPWTPLLVLRPVANSNADVKKQSRLELNTTNLNLQPINTPLPHSKEMIYSNSKPNTVVLEVVGDSLEEGGMEHPPVSSSEPALAQPQPAPASSIEQQSTHDSQPVDTTPSSNHGGPAPLPVYTLVIPHIPNPPPPDEELSTGRPPSNSDEALTDKPPLESSPAEVREQSPLDSVAGSVEEPSPSHENSGQEPAPVRVHRQEEDHRGGSLETKSSAEERLPESGESVDYDNEQSEHDDGEEVQKVYRIELSGGPASQSQLQVEQPEHGGHDDDSVAAAPGHDDTTRPWQEPTASIETIPESVPVQEPPAAAAPPHSEALPSVESIESREESHDQPPTDTDSGPLLLPVDIIPERERPLSLLNKHRIDTRLEYETVLPPQQQHEGAAPPVDVSPSSTTTDYILHSLSSLNLVKTLLEASDSSGPPPTRSYSGVNQPLRPKPHLQEDEEEHESSDKIILLSDGNFLLTAGEDGSILKKVRLSTEEEDGSLDRLLSMMMKVGPSAGATAPASSEESHAGQLGSVSHNVHLLLPHDSEEDRATSNGTTSDTSHPVRSPKLDTSFRSLSQGQQVPVPLILAAASAQEPPQRNSNSTGWTPSKLTSLRINSNSPVYKFVLRRGQTVDDLLREIFKNYTERGLSVQAAAAGSPGLDPVYLTTPTTTAAAPPSTTTATTTITTTTKATTATKTTQTPHVQTSTSISVHEQPPCPSNSTFQCANGHCVSPHSRCNGVRECRDGSDEYNCTCAEHMRSNLMERKICDGWPDCADLSDEYGACPWCQEGAYICSGTRTCIPKEKLCDSKRDCPRGDDESDCVKIAPSLDTDSELAPTYHRTGYLMVRKKGTWGKLCVDSFSTVLKHWEIKDLARAVCKAKTFGDFESVERVTDEQVNSFYYELFDGSSDHQNTSEPHNRSTIGFKVTSCSSRSVVRVSCQDLQCGVAPRAFQQREQPSARIVGGSNALPGEWPWQAALYKDGEYQCGATLISSRWLLSAGHCFYHAQDSYWTARLGSLRRGSNSISSPYEQVVRISHVLLHPHYKDVGFVNDVSLLRLEHEVEFTDFIRPVCLPGKEERIRDGRLCTVVGWGQLFEVGRVFPDTLQEVQLPLISTAECRKRTLFLPLYKLTDQMFCAGFDRGGRDACLGDSGGPLMCSESDGRSTLYGVTSNGYGCARANRPGVYTKVSAYIDWIEERMRQEYRDVSKAECPGFRCRLGECLDSKRVCNGFNDCDGGEDERNCSSTSSAEWS